MTFEQQWLEYDYNPFIIFSSNGKVLSANSEAQFLLGSASIQELFELASSYANITFGFKTTFLDLEFGRYKFFGLTVGYENENEIGLKLLQLPSFKINKPKNEGKLSNIYSLIDLCIATNSISLDIEFIKDFDPTIPDIRLNTSNFIKLLNKIYFAYSDSNFIKTKLFFRVGEHLKFEDKKYSLFSVEVVGNVCKKDAFSELKVYIDKSDFYVEIKETVVINIPMIVD